MANITKPTLGASGWNAAVDALIDDHNASPLTNGNTAFTGAQVGQALAVAGTGPTTFALRSGGPEVAHIDDYGSDPTGVATSSAAFNAALAALPTVTIAGTVYRRGTIALGRGTYLFDSSVDTANIGPLVSVLGPGKGACTLRYTGSTRALYMHDVGIPTKFVNLAVWSGTINGFTLDGTGSAAGAIGIDYGDTEGGLIGPDLLIKGFTGTGSVGLYIANRYWWTENVRIQASIFGCDTCLMFNGTRGPGANSYNSLEYLDVDVKLYLLPNQRGVVLDNGAWFGNGSLKIRANCALSSSANTGALLTIKGQSAAGHLNTNEYSYITACRLDIRAENNSSVDYGSTYGPKTIVFGAVNNNGIRGTVGSWIFDGPGWQSFDGTGWTKSNIQHLGQVVGDTTLNPETGYRGPITLGPLLRPVGYIASPTAQIRVPSGDYHRLTLSQHVTVQLINGYALPHEMVIAITQAASGGPYTVAWQTNGSPTVASPTIVWPGGVAPTMNPNAGATDVYRLVTLDGITYYGSVVSSTSGITQAAAKGCRLYVSGTQTGVLTSGATTTVTGLTQDFNDDAWLYTLNLANGSIAPTRAGMYLASWSVRMGGGASGKRFGYVQVNGAVKREAAVPYSSLQDVTALGSFPFRLAANDVVTMAAFVDGGSAANVVGTASYNSGLTLLYLGA